MHPTPWKPSRRSRSSFEIPKDLAVAPQPTSRPPRLICGRPTCHRLLGANRQAVARFRAPRNSCWTVFFRGDSEEPSLKVTIGEEVPWRLAVSINPVRKIRRFLEWNTTRPISVRLTWNFSISSCARGHMNRSFSTGNLSEVTPASVSLHASEDTTSDTFARTDLAQLPLRNLVGCQDSEEPINPLWNRAGNR